MSEEDINIIENFLNYNKEYLSVIEIASISKLLKVYREQQKEIEELKEMKPLQDLIDTNIIIADYSHNYISKDKIREFIKKELPDDEIMKWNIIYDVNGIDLRIKLEKMLEEK